MGNDRGGKKCEEIYVSTSSVIAIVLVNPIGMSKPHPYPHIRMDILFLSAVFSSSDSILSGFSMLYFVDHPPRRHFVTFVVIVGPKREE